MLFLMPYMTCEIHFHVGCLTPGETLSSISCLCDSWNINTSREGFGSSRYAGI